MSTMPMPGDPQEEIARFRTLPLPVQSDLKLVARYTLHGDPQVDDEALLTQLTDTGTMPMPPEDVVAATLRLQRHYPTVETYGPMLAVAMVYVSTVEA